MTAFWRAASVVAEAARVWHRLLVVDGTADKGEHSGNTWDRLSQRDKVLAILASNFLSTRPASP